MALHSIHGKTTAQDPLAQRQALGTVGITNVKDTNVRSSGRVVTKDAQIIVNDGTNDRVLIGFSAGGF